MPAFIDLTGQRFGRLTVVSWLGGKREGYSDTYWLCKCDCGGEARTSTYNLRAGHAKSCGCLARESAHNRFHDLTGQRFGRLYVEKRVESKNGKSQFLCKCDCGNEKIIYGVELSRHHVSSCGCLYLENKEKVCGFKHGMSDTKLFKKWDSMKRRCYDKNNKQYERYGGRGIYICDEWLNDFKAFYDWSYANGYDPNAEPKDCSLDRIDNDGPYAPENCRWATAKQQQRNRRITVYLTANGETRPLSEWAEIMNIPHENIRQRLRLGWSEQDAVTQPISKKQRYRKGVKRNTN